MHPAEVIFAAIAVLGGAYVRGYSGFGSSLFWISSLSLVLPPAEVIPTVFMLEVAASVRLLPKVWRDIDWRSLRWLLLGTLITTPPGIYLLATVPAAPIRVAISVVVLTATVLLWQGFSLKRMPGPTPTVLTGLLCGLLNGSTGIAGPPAILFFFSSPAAATVSRASIIAFFLGTDSYGTAVAATQGLVTADVLMRTALLLPVVLTGIALGNRRFIRTEPEAFRRFALLLLALLSVAVFLRALLG
ncbi:MAG: TSUP family transporter [Acidiferrobacterales bacterium]